MLSLFGEVTHDAESGHWSGRLSGTFDGEQPGELLSLTHMHHVDVSCSECDSAFASQMNTWYLSPRLLRFAEHTIAPAEQCGGVSWPLLDSVIVKGLPVAALMAKADVFIVQDSTKSALLPHQVLPMPTLSIYGGPHVCG